MGGKKRGASGGSKTAQQQPLTSFALPLLKKPWRSTETKSV